MIYLSKIFGNVDVKNSIEKNCEILSLTKNKNLYGCTLIQKQHMTCYAISGKHINISEIFFGREVLFVQDSEKDDMGFRGFISRHSRFIVKPLAMNCGKGIQVLDTSMQDISSYSLLKRYKDGFVAEELIVQDDSLAQFHPASVNTLRIHTVNYGDSLEILWPCLRIGCGGSIVDNAGAGGIFGAVDVDTGRIVAVSDEFHHTFDVHPDTGIHVLGYEIPRWKEACEMAKRLALCMPDCPFVGWDLALTEKGWLMVEGNYGPLLIWQIAVGKGIRKEFNRMKQKIGS